MGKPNLIIGDQSSSNLVVLFSSLIVSFNNYNITQFLLL